MKHYLLGFATILLCFLNISYANAGWVERSNIDMVAKNWYRHYAPESKKQAVITKSIPYKYNGRECFRIVSFDKGGFVLVSANDAVTPVLGYGFDKPVPDSISNEAMKGWFDNYARQIDTAFVLNLQNNAFSQKWDEILQNSFPKTPLTSVGPLLTTTWDQGCYYNEMCPSDAAGVCGHTLVGCTATAMAQILKFWNYPEGGIGFNSYLPKTNIQYGLQSIFFNETDYDWSAMTNSVTIQNPAVATLMYHSGVSTNMDYSISGSGANLSKAANGFKANFDYSDSLMQLYRSSVSDSTWIITLKQNVNSGRPVLLDGYNYSITSGHAWVCDGYQDGNYFHMNWGWSGSANGYYYYDSIAPGFFNFNYSQSALVNIFPNYSALTADFYTTKTDQPLQLQFVDHSKGNPGSFYWNFGDSTISILQNPVHIYSDTGIYLVRLIVDKGNSHDTIEKRINVSLQPFLATSITLGGIDGQTGFWFDYDNDNDLDIILSGYPLGTRIYRNDSTSFTQINPGFPFNNTPNYGDPGDVDNDGDLDLVMTGSCLNYQAETKLYQNNSGSFNEVAEKFPDICYPVSFADYNNDGKLDVLLFGGKGKQNGQSVGLYKNLGNGIFKRLENLSFPVLNVAGSASWGDIDNDGDLDLALTIFNAGTIKIYIYINKGNDLFEELPDALPCTSNCRSVFHKVQFFDYNGDGKLDLSLSSPAIIFKNNGNSNFTQIADTSIANTYAEYLDWGDFDNDGDPDLLVGKKLLRNEGNDVFSSVSTEILGGGSTVSYTSYSTFGDYNNDSKLDILAWGYNLGFLAKVYKNVSGTGNTPPSIPQELHADDSLNNVKLRWNPSNDNSTPQPSISYNVRVGTTPAGNEIVSCSSDPESGFRRMVKYGNAGLNSFYLLNNLPNGKYYWAVQAIDNSFAASHFSVVDSFYIAGNNLAPELNHFNMTAYLNSNNSFNCTDIQENYSDPENDTVRSIRIDSLPLTGSVKFDGIPVLQGQVIPVNQLSGLVYRTNNLKNDTMYVNVYDGINWGTHNARIEFNVLLFEPAEFEITPELSAFALGDYDYDGDLDLASQSRIYKFTDGTFHDLGLTLSGSGSVHWGDIDSDSDMDLIVGEKIYKNEGNDQFNCTQTLSPVLDQTASDFCDINNSNSLDYVRSGQGYSSLLSRLYQNSGQGVYSDSLMNLMGFRSGQLAWGDFDNDGDQDLVIGGIYGNNDRKTIIYRNDNGQFVDIQAELPGVNYGTYDWGDFDRDGDLDLLICGTQGTVNNALTRIYKNDHGIFRYFDANFPPTFRGFAKWVDVNNDGNLDIIIEGYINFPDKDVRLFINDNGSAFHEITATGLPKLADAHCAIGDLNNDGFPDIFLSGLNPQGDTITTIYRNCYGIDSVLTNTPPSVPDDLTMKRISGSTVRFSWEPATDNTTAQEAITYNLFIGRSPDSTQICSPLACLSTGKLKLAKSGNVGNNLSWTVHSLAPGLYYWSVQAIDNSYRPSVFSSTQSFTINDPFVRDTIWYIQNEPIHLDQSVFELIFEDFDHDTLQKVRIEALPQHGSIELNNIPLVYGQEILSSELNLLIYTPAPEFYGKDSIKWNGHNGMNYADQEATIHWIITPFQEAPFIFDSLAYGNAVWGDFNNDGKLDIANTGRNNQEYKTLIWRRELTSFSSQRLNSALPFGGGLYPWIKWCDVDGDNDLDGIKGSKLDIYKFENNTFNSSMFPVFFNWGFGFDLVDYDNDNSIDYFSGNMLYHNVNGSYSFTGQYLDIFILHNSPTSVIDINNDGKQDIASSAQNSPFVICYGKGDGTFNKTITSIPMFVSGSIDWGDFNNDEFSDLLILGVLQGEIPITKIYNNNGGLLTESPCLLEQLSYGTARWGDYNNDGRLDILMCGAKQNGVPVTLLYKNTQAGFVLQPTNIPGVKYGSAEWGDYDNDGDLDIILMGVDSLGRNITKIFMNTYGQNKFIVNSPPSIPANLHDSVSGQTVFLNWDKSTDNTTPQDGLTYNLYIGTSPGSVDILSPMADLTTGFLRVVKRGNTDHNNHWHIGDLQPGRYYWSVQAIDNSFAASHFAAVDSFDIQPGVQLSGHLKYNNASSTSLDSLRMYLMNGPLRIDSCRSNAEGFYQFGQVFSGAYNLGFTCNKPWSGVNGTDALKIQRHFAGLEPITEPVRLQAADVNNSNSINGTDALKVKRRFAGLDTTFVRGDWTFAKPIVGGDSIVIGGTNISQDFYGLCVGDVNGSYVPQPGMKSSSGVLMSYSDTIFVQPEQEFDLPVWVDKDLSLSAVSLVIELPSEKIQVLDVKMNSGTVIYHMFGNSLRMAWSELQPLELSQGGQMLWVRMKVIRHQSEYEIIQAHITNECELADVNANVLRGVTLKTKTIKLLASSNPASDGSDHTLTILPNPNSGQFRVQVAQTISGTFDLILVDTKGTQIRELNKIQITSGLSGLLDLKGLPSGVYYLKLKNESMEYNGKIIIK
ncbi:MAG: FG-GAP-like repeat-containing protein [Bacteroidota bacterium]